MKHRMVDAFEAPPLVGFQAEPFDGRVVYYAGSGPGVVVCHELPGITPQVQGFARRLVDAGFTVAMPWLFGDPGRKVSLGYVLKEQARVCISREFQLLASHRESPLTNWVRELCRALHARVGGPGVGVVGMCVTGNFGLTLMLEPAVIAPVLSQPSLPLGFGAERRAALHATSEAVACARRRVASGEAGLMALRFTADVLCPGERFETLAREIPGCELIEIDSHRGNAHGIWPLAHSVLTNDLVDRAGHPTRAALDNVLGFLDKHLQRA